MERFIDDSKRKSLHTARGILFCIFGFIITTPPRKVKMNFMKWLMKQIFLWQLTNRSCRICAIWEKAVLPKNILDNRKKLVYHKGETSV